FVYPGLSTAEQCAQGRYEILATSYREYEYRIRKQMMRMFSRYGFDPELDIGGIILNRWGHAYVVPEPGFYFGKNGRPAARDIVRQSFGRIAFAHSELKGFQTFRGAVQEGERAVAQIADLI
ncbi:MAG: NAD(P)/FAD-dependent oxidoreductase, partial [Gammaproteobacteria bacterium]|nr:NAD(P)/FAD-dependent oxidoreductase [Gammaproteobacteria bacterium]